MSSIIERISAIGIMPVITKIDSPEDLDALAKAYTEMHPDSPIVFANMPSYDELAATPVGHFLNSPSAEGGT